MKPSHHAYLFLFQAPYPNTVLWFFFFASCACLSIMLFQNIAAFALLQYPTYTWAATNYTSEALNPQLTNTIGDNGGPTLYYNGSGPVPP